jgi:hypothetical protein
MVLIDRALLVQVDFEELVVRCAFEVFVPMSNEIAVL